MRASPLLLALLLSISPTALLSAQSRLGPTDGVAAIRQHRSGVDVRWENKVGRPLSELAIISTARERDQPYEWSLHEMEALAVGLDRSIIDVVRNRQPLTGVPEPDAVIIQLAREISTHKVSPETYQRGVKAFGEASFVDVVTLMGQYAATATRLSAFNQQMPADFKQFLPLPFTPPADIHPDSRSRLPLIPTRPASTSTKRPVLYSRSLVPEGTGPGEIGRHGGGRGALEASQGRPLMDVAGLIAARAADQQFDWTMTELAARKDGVAPAVIEAIRDAKPTTGLSEKEAALIDVGRQLLAKHFITAASYAKALAVFGEKDLVDLVGVMAQHTDDATLLTVFDQQLPAGQQPLLPGKS